MDKEFILKSQLRTKEEHIEGLKKENQVIFIFNIRVIATVYIATYAPCVKLAVIEKQRIIVKYYIL